MAGLWILSVLPVLLFEMCFCAYLLASHLLDLVKGLVEVVLAALVALVVVVHVCVYSLGDSARRVSKKAIWFDLI